MSVLIKLREHKSLSNSESEVRDYILKNSKSVITMSTQELASKSFTSPATVIRLCQRLGLKGFSELKIMIASELKSFENMNLKILDSTTFKKDDDIDAIINKVTEVTLKSIEETSLLIDKTLLKKAASKIIEADILDFYGTGASNTIAFDASYKFMRIGKSISCLSLTDRQRVQAINSNSKHFAFIVSYSGETEEMLEIARILQSNNVPTLAITSSSENTMMHLVDYPFCVSSRESNLRNGAIVSRTSTLYMLDLIYITCTQLDYDNSINTLKKTLTISK